MSWLNIFKKVLDIASNPVTVGVVKAINPLAGLLLSTAVQGISTVQVALPGAGNDALKKQIVMNLMASQGAALGIAMDEAQTSVLVEGFLKAIKDSANTAPTRPIPVPTAVQTAPALVKSVT